MTTKDPIIYKNYRITPLGTFAMYKIQSPGSGPVPKDLEGTYTTPTLAKLQIDRSLAGLLGKHKKRVINEQTESTVTG